MELESHNDIKEDLGLITLFVGDNEEMVCQIYTIFEVHGQDYIVLCPLVREHRENGEFFILRYSENEQEEFSVENIEDDDEFEMVSEVFDELLDKEEFDELVDASLVDGFDEPE